MGAAALAATILVSAGAVAQQDPPLPTLSITPTSRTVNENAGAITFTATLSSAYAASTGTDVTFSFYLTGDDRADHRATSGEDFDFAQGQTGQVTIAAGQRSATIEIDITDDELDEYDEGFVLSLDPNNLTNAEFSDSLAHYHDEERTYLLGHYMTVTILDNDDPPQLTFAPEDGQDSVTEKGRILRYQLALSEPSGRPVRVAYEVLPGLKSINSGGQLSDLPDSDCGSFTANDVCQKATPVADYGPSGNQTWRADSTPTDTTDDVLDGVYVFQPGETGGPAVGSTVDFNEINIFVVDDTDVDVNDRDETLTIRLLASPTFEFATTADQIAHGLILDDDLPRVSFNQWGYGPENGITSGLGVSISPVVPTGGDPVTVKVRSVHGNRIPGNFSLQDDGEAVCSGTPGEDFEDIDITLTFGPGERFKRAEYEEYDDEIAEPVERYCLELYDVSQNGILELEPIWYNVIYDTDPPPLVTVSSPTAAEQDGQVTFEVQLTRRGTETVELDYETVDGTATAPADYTARSGTLAFPADETTSKSVTIQLERDSLDEPNEQFELVVSGAETNVEVARGTATIIDSDGTPRLSVQGAFAQEDAGTIDFRVTLSGRSSRPITVSYDTEVVAANGDTATEGASCTTGVDYIAKTGSLEFAAGQTGFQEIPVTLCDDSTFEGDETFTLTLSSPSSAEFAGQASSISAIGDIDDNERPPSFSVANVTGEEEDGAVVFEVTLGSESDSTATVEYTTEQLTGTNAATSGSDCSVTGADFGDESGTLTFNPGDLTLSVTVALCADGLDEETETLRLKLSNPSGAPIASGGGTATGTILDSDDPPELSVAAVAAVDEDAGPAQFTVTLTTASGKTVTVRYSTVDTTATAGRDYTAASNQLLTFAPGDTSKTVDVPVIDDSLDEADTETFRLLLSNPTNATLQSGGDGATGTINDDDDLPALSISGGTAREDVTALNPNNGVVFTIMLDAVSGRDVEVDLETFTDTDDTATEDLDYASLSGNAIISAGQRSVRVTVAVLNDTLDEANETFSMGLSGETNATLETADSIAKGTITDDNDPAVDLQIDNVTVDEGGTATFSVTLAAESGQEVTVNYETVNGTATADSDCVSDGDFIETSGTLTFPAGQTAHTGAAPAVTICDDDIDEPDETFGLRLRLPTNATAPADPATGLITDNDGPPGLTVDDPRELEGAGKVTFTVTLAPVSGKEVTVKYATADGTAEAGRDYTAKSGSLTFRPGETSKTTEVRVTNDATSEPEEETFTLVLSDPQNATGDGASGTATIVDDDGDPALSVRDVRAAEGNVDGVITFTVRLSAGSDQEVTVNYATSGGTATSGTDCDVSGDFEETSGTLTFTAGTIEQTVPVPICDDSRYETDEDFTLTLSNPTNAVVGGPTATATATITDNDRAPSFSVADATSRESDGTLEFEVTLGSESDSTATVDYTTEQLTGANAATSGSACSVTGADFDDESGTLTFNPGDLTQTVQVALCADGLDEETETLRLKLSNPSGAPIAGGGGTATGTILDSDDPPELYVTDASSVAEDADPAEAEFTVTLTAASAKTVTVRYTTADGTAAGGSSCTSGNDFRSRSATLTFRPGEALTQTVSVPICDDSLDEEDSETFTLTLDSPANATLQSGGEAATGTITDDDDPPSLSFVSDVTASESAGTMTFAVRLSGASGRTVEVDYSTADDTATAGQDYVALSSERLSFTAGDTQETITVQILNDALDESNETFTLRLFSPSNATLSADPLEATGTITDNDPAVDLEIENATADESGTATFRVTLATASAQEVTVDYATVNGTATGGSDCNADGADFATTSGTLTFPAQSTTPTEGNPTVTICDDTLDEFDETFGLQLRNPMNATAPSDAATGLITDNDTEPDLSVDSPRIVEGAVSTVSFEVTLSDESAKEVTVKYATADGTAEAGQDYTAKSGSLRFAAGDTSETVQVSVTNDQISEPDETFTLVLSDPSNATANTPSGTATIVDNDGEPGLRVNDITVRERAGAVVQFTVTLEPISSDTVTVDYTTADGTALADSDYRATDGTLTFRPGEGTKTVDVIILGDTTAEPDETFTLVLSNQNPSTVDLDDDTGEATITERTITTGGGGGDDEEDDEVGGTSFVSTNPAAAPRIGIFLQDVVLVLNEPPLRIDLIASVVGAIDTYRALAANPGIVTAIVSGSMLTLAPEALGTTTVSVSASNSRGSVFQTFRVTVIERSAPKFASLLPNRVLYVGDPPVGFDVSSAFTGTVSSYTASAGDPNLVGVSTTGSRVSLTGLVPGVTTVTVRALNANGVALQSFTVTVLTRQASGTDPPGPVQEIPTH